MADSNTVVISEEAFQARVKAKRGGVLTAEEFDALSGKKAKPVLKFKGMEEQQALAGQVSSGGSAAPEPKDEDDVKDAVPADAAPESQASTASDDTDDDDDDDDTEDDSDTEDNEDEEEELTVAQYIAAKGNFLDVLAAIGRLEEELTDEQLDTVAEDASINRDELKRVFKAAVIADEEGDSL